RDEKSVLLTWDGATPRQLFQQDRYQRYLRDPTIHTALGFSIGLAQMHTSGEFQSVLPPGYRAEVVKSETTRSRSTRESASKPTLRPAAKPSFVVAGRHDAIDRSKLQDALEKLKSGHRSR